MTHHLNSLTLCKKMLLVFGEMFIVRFPSTLVLVKFRNGDFFRYLGNTY